MSGVKVCVLPAGSYGTALASVLADNDADVMLWSRNEAIVSEINTEHTNQRFHPDIHISSQIKATTSIKDALDGARMVILASPSSAMRDIVQQVRPFLHKKMIIVHATKGFEMDTLKRMTTVIADELPEYDHNEICVLSGPSHAEEVIRKSPTTVVVASQSTETAQRVQDLLINPYFRVYTNSDVIGVEVGGALKNIIALGAGLSDGLGFGDNAKAALITRGLAEIARLGTAMGANPLTFAGLAGVGDLVVTCTSKHSRNWRAGYQLAQDKKLDEVLESMGMVVEGVKTTKAAYSLASKYNVEMPITEQLYQVLFENKSPKHAVEDLMGRGRTHEIEELAGSVHEKWFARPGD
jgi:glycerol-3-phosphate dehydrogenase (NAD(P)+)